ncbi:MAG: hypothetical protein CMM60_04845 [Rhodospirillaceae bacterium]|mgnify:CR=1 FL=1|jgi:DeoR/GlpR family transcriptional regulator of sugar metabolism|nr:hypothetical protein [Rhodospirillaceae bacterium]
MSYHYHFISFIIIISLSLAEVINAIINASKEVNLLADSTKFNEAGITSVGPVSSVNRIFTDHSIDVDLAEKYRQTGVEMVIA